MKITRSQIRKIIRESIILEQEEEEDKDFDPAELQGINIPAPLKKLLSPDITLSLIHISEPTRPY